ncbi:MAG: hypothetical protein ABR905_18235 [Terracidiphilus sp.]|jgi:hypothetical protein
MANNASNCFYVILTNISNQPQIAFEDWNSWGYQAISSEIESADGKKISLARKPHGFTRNFPSTFLIPPGEHMVYPIRLNDEWDALSSIPLAVQTPIEITLSAIYEVDPTPESASEKVWTGRVESIEYQFKFSHY